MTIQKLNFQNRFEIVYNDYDYVFTTPAGVEYHIVFVDYSGILEIDCPVYMLTIDRIIPPECVNIFDDRSKISILYILHLFFENNENAIIALYDTVDGMHKARKRLFGTWFEKYNTLNIIKIEEKVLIDEGISTTATLLFLDGNKNKEKLIRAFNNIVNDNFYC